MLDGKDLAGVAEAPETFYCPITKDVMRDPVLLPTGQTYERRAIEKWLRGGGRSCPATGQPVNPDVQLIPNLALRRTIEDWASVHCPAILERATGKLRPFEEEKIPERKEEEAMEGPSVGQFLHEHCQWYRRNPARIRTSMTHKTFSRQRKTLCVSPRTMCGYGTQVAQTPKNPCTLE